MTGVKSKNHTSKTNSQLPNVTGSLISEWLANGLWSCPLSVVKVSLQNRTELYLMGGLPFLRYDWSLG